MKLDNQEFLFEGFPLPSFLISEWFFSAPITQFLFSVCLVFLRTLKAAEESSIIPSSLSPPLHSPHPSDNIQSCSDTGLRHTNNPQFGRSWFPHYGFCVLSSITKPFSLEGFLYPSKNLKKKKKKEEENPWEPPASII